MEFTDVATSQNMIVRPNDEDATDGGFGGRTAVDTAAADTAVAVPLLTPV